MDKSDIEIEGNINPIPKSINISNKFVFDLKESLNHTRHNSLTLKRTNISNSLYNKDSENDKLRNTVKVEKYKYNLKSEDSSNSITTKLTINDKLKKVTFSTVEIIRVTNYKKYNKLNSIKKNESNNSIFEDKSCFIF